MGQLARVLSICICGMAANACGAVALVGQGNAAGAMERAQQRSPTAQRRFEYFAAREYLEKAREEAAEGQYQDAIRFADSSHEFARQLGAAETRGSR